MVTKINHLLDKIGTIEDDDIASNMLNYICILISGYLETSIENVISDYKQTRHCNTHECKDNIKSLRKIQNAKWCVIRPIIMNIDENILTSLKNEFDQFDNVISSIDNIVKTRHKIAHGKNVTNLTIEILKADFQHIQQFLIKIKNLFNNYYTDG